MLRPSNILLSTARSSSSIKQATPRHTLPVPNIARRLGLQDKDTSEQLQQQQQQQQQQKRPKKRPNKRRPAAPSVSYDEDTLDTFEMPDHDRLSRAGYGELPFNPQQYGQLRRGVFPKDYPPEIIHVKTNRDQFRGLQWKFENGADRTSRRGGRVTHDPDTSVTAICSHSTAIYNWAIQAVKTSLTKPLVVRREPNPFRIESHASHVLSGERGETKSPAKLSADLAVIPRRIGSGKQKPRESKRPIWALQVGFAETYEELSKIMHSWFEACHSTNMVLLLKVEEHPVYKPELILNSLRDLRAQNVPPKRLVSSTSLRVQDRSDSYGPIMLQGIVWAGRMTAFMEVWVRDENGNIVQKGDRTTFGAPNTDSQFLTIQTSDFIPGETLSQSQKINFNLDSFRAGLDEARHKHAFDRAQLVLKTMRSRMRRKDEIQDFVDMMETGPKGKKRNIHELEMKLEEKKKEVAQGGGGGGGYGGKRRREKIHKDNLFRQKTR
ncbi:hypothetical protein AJ80_01817 [Polytolypa hystricis UAMH7299]|uniref:Uncharacterized protein n=1 Tax=Polytolypa hystricis (strain UAMH7299) TaxID=1447883 RepID=A0A2B7YZV7_POLH7|nr:hypothetical protein AJ80_01817 [Polytolypa hystricis UAMH7299]